MIFEVGRVNRGLFSWDPRVSSGVGEESGALMDEADVEGEDGGEEESEEDRRDKAS